MNSKGEDGISGIGSEPILESINDGDDSAGEDDISGIDSERISEIVFAKWQIEKKNLRQISVEMNLPIAEVQRILCNREKLLFQKGS